MGRQSDGFEDEREEELRRRERAQRYARARREKERQLRRRRLLRVCLAGALCLAAVIGAVTVIARAVGKKSGGAGAQKAQAETAFGESVRDVRTGDEADASGETGAAYRASGAAGYSAADITGYDVAEGAEDGASGGMGNSGGTGNASGGTENASGDTASGSGGAGNLTGSAAAAGQGGGTDGGSGSTGGAPEQSGIVRVGDAEFLAGFTAQETEDTHGVDPEQVTSTYALLIDESTNEIVAEQNAHEIINPASMTKILTVLVAAEQVKDLDEKVAVTIEATDYAFSHDCSTAGFAADEQVPVRDLFYGTVLPSGADAAVALAIHAAGSQEAFVELMNEKLEELGLSATAHFTNCVGLYDEAHHCTVYDMAMILKAAVENDFCREVLSAHTYTTAQTEAHPEGILLSNWFLRRIEDKDTGGEVLCAKTGFVNQSGNCAASYQVTDSGRPYICVTADAHSSWRCIYDHVAMYSLYAE